MRKVFKVDNEGMAECQTFLSELCEDPKPAIIQDELVSNIVRCSGASEFGIDFTRNDDGTITMVFSDNGRAFDPMTEVADPDLTTDVSRRRIGGLGIFMVKKMSRSIEYKREEDRNVLTVVI